MTGGDAIHATISVDPTTASVKSISGCSLQLRNTLTPPDFYLDCSYLKVTLHEVKDDGSDPSMDWAATVVLAGSGVTAKALASGFTQQ